MLWQNIGPFSKGWKKKQPNRACQTLEEPSFRESFDLRGKLRLESSG